MSVLALCGGTAFSQSQLDAFKYSQTELERVRSEWLSQNGWEWNLSIQIY